MFLPGGSDITSGSEVSAVSSTGRVSCSASTSSAYTAAATASAAAVKSKQRRRPTLVLETLEHGIPRHYLMPRGVTRRRQLKQKGKWELIVQIFSPYKYHSVKLRARWQCIGRIYDLLSLIYKRVIKQALYNFQMVYPH